MTDVGALNEISRATLGHRTPSVIKQMGLVCLFCSVLAFYRVSQNPAEVLNCLEMLAILWIAYGFFSMLSFSGQVSYTSQGFHIRQSGLRSLLGKGKEHFVSFDEIRKMVPDKKQHQGQEWLQFGVLEIKTRRPREDRNELYFNQVFLNRAQLADVLQSLRDSRPTIIDQTIIDLLLSSE